MPEKPKGCRYWDRKSPDAPWTLAGIECFSPLPGILKVGNYYSSEYGLRQQVWYEFEMKGGYENRSRIFAADGSVVSTLRCRQLSDRIEQQYIAADGRPITTLYIFEHHFEVLTHPPYLAEGTQRRDFEGDDHLIEFFERDGINITFESMETVTSDTGEVLETRNSRRRWTYRNDEEGRRIKSMYRDGRLQRERYAEELQEPVSFPLVR